MIIKVSWHVFFCLTVPRGEEKSALPLELLRHRVFIAEMFTLRKPLSHIILLLAVIHIFTVANPSHIKKKKYRQCVFHFSCHCHIQALMEVRL